MKIYLQAKKEKKSNLDLYCWEYDLSKWISEYPNSDFLSFGLEHIKIKLMERSHYRN